MALPFTLCVVQVLERNNDGAFSARARQNGGAFLGNVGIAH
jgi:hypothetical protein